MDAKINNKLFSVFGARLLQSYVAGGTPVENHFFHGVNRSNWAQLKTYFGLRPITLTVIFEGSDLATVTLHKSQLDAELFGKCELLIPDGFYYDCHAVTLGDAEVLADSEDGALLQAEYALEGIRHGAKQTISLPANSQYRWKKYALTANKRDMSGRLVLSMHTLTSAYQTLQWAANYTISNQSISLVSPTNVNIGYNQFSNADYLKGHYFTGVVGRNGVFYAPSTAIVTRGTSVESDYVVYFVAISPYSIIELSPGEYIGDVYAATENAYPQNGASGDYWYIYDGEGIYNPGTMPFTDCKLSVTVSTAAESYSLGGAVFHNVAANERLVFDGIEGKILRNGVPNAANVTWTHFPALTPGNNTITATDAVTVEFYPAYL